MASNHLNPNMNFWSHSVGMLPLAPAPPNLQYQQLNDPLQMNSPSLSIPNAQQEPSQDTHFPVRLHYMLTDIQKDGLFTHIVSWQPHGRCFVVHDKKQFVEKILCLWFRQSKWASFQRQLNMYGFRRLSSGPDKGGYYHELFLRMEPALAQRIQRQKVKGTGPRRPAQPDQEPNFYALSNSTPEVGLSQLQRPLMSSSRLAKSKAATNTITLKTSLALPAPAPEPLSSPFTMSRSLPIRAPERKYANETQGILPPNFSRPMNDDDDIDTLEQLAAWF